MTKPQVECPCCLDNIMELEPNSRTWYCKCGAHMNDLAINWLHYFNDGTLHRIVEDDCVEII